MRSDATGLPRFDPDQRLTLDTASGVEEWTGQQWNDYADAARRNQNLIAVRFLHIGPMDEYLARPAERESEPTVPESATEGRTAATDTHSGRADDVGLDLRQLERLVNESDRAVRRTETAYRFALAGAALSIGCVGALFVRGLVNGWMAYSIVAGTVFAGSVVALLTGRVGR